MTNRRNPRSRSQEQPPGLFDDEYRRFVPGSGYTPPPPPERPYARGQDAWRNYASLRRRARNSSMAWWWLKIVQGALLGGGLVALGAVIAIIFALAAGSNWPSTVGILLVLAGALVFVRYLAAPLTCRWIVTVPENWYYVVEDGDGYTLEYLEPGRMIVPWRWQSRVVEYVDFNTIVINEEVEDVLDSDALPVDIEVSVVMAFNPVDADPDLYPALRKMRSQEQFQAMLARDVRDIVRKHMNTLEPVKGRGMLHNVKSLEGVIVEQIAGRAALGLVPASARPVTVHVRAPQKVKEAYQSLWARTARVREESETLRDIKDLARELDLPYEDAFQLFYIMQRGTPLPTATARRLGQHEPMYILQQPTMPDPSGATLETAEHAAVSESVPDEAAPADEPPETRPVIHDPDRAPDPLDKRRQRRRRSRRAPD